MGSCISKCRPKKKSKDDDDPCRHVHVDKLVISKDPPPTAPDITIIPSEKPLSPAPSTSSASSFSSFAYSTNSKSALASSISSSSLSSSSSSSYSSSVLKDRTFSNDYLRSYVKENPHVIGLNQKSVEKTALTALTAKTVSTPKKRARAASPPLVRQKSFRKEQSCPNRGLRSSPPPSRRFNGESNRIFPVKESNYYRKPVSSTPKRESFQAPTPSPKRESFRAPTPSPKRETKTSMISEYSVRKNDAILQHISSKIDGREIDVVMEDINNPLIALDCFIFL